MSELCEKIMGISIKKDEMEDAIYDETGGIDIYGIAEPLYSRGHADAIHAAAALVDEEEAGRRWRDVRTEQEEEEPEQYERVLFVVRDSDDDYDGLIFIGKFQEIRNSIGNFSIPGMTLGGIYWMPLSVFNLPPVPGDKNEHRIYQKAL